MSLVMVAVEGIRHLAEGRGLDLSLHSPFVGLPPRQTKPREKTAGIRVKPETQHTNARQNEELELKSKST